VTDEYSKEVQPYIRKNRSLAISDIRKSGTFTKDATRIAIGLNKFKIACRMEYEVIRFGEFRNGHPLTYSIDILVVDSRYRPVAIEVEGEGSSSKNNDARDAYLGSLGLSVMHVPNSTPSIKVIEQLDKFYRKNQVDFQ
jgi:hypothetical protein